MMLPSPARDVIYREMSEGAVLFHTVDEVYYGLNEVGRQVWSLLPPVCTTLEEVCAEVQRRYPEVDPEIIRADVREMLDELVDFGLLTVAEVSHEPGAAAVPVP